MRARACTKQYRRFCCVLAKTLKIIFSESSLKISGNFDSSNLQDFAIEPTHRTFSFLSELISVLVMSLESFRVQPDSKADMIPYYQMISLLYISVDLLSSNLQVSRINYY